ncbi:MAG: M56 family metallopeptidase [Tidjanibacter sp.]|nr:M56 family metallopeptidase [Tidjanibacter sp.]
MQEFVTYWGKVAVVIAIFYLFFKILLSRETYHRLNRAVLLATAILSFVLPLCVITIYRPVTIKPFATTNNTEFQSAYIVEQMAEQSTTIDLWSIAFVVFLIGAIAVMVWSGYSIISIYRLMGTCKEVERLPEGRVVVCKEKISPFSWFGNIVLSERDWEESGKIIITHERSHIALHHSADILFMNLCCALQWFNPAMWLLRRDLREIHEYEADERVLLSGVSAKEYQLLLIKKAVGNKSYSIANSLNHSTLKNRITMMLQKKSSRASRMRVLYLLPLVCLSLTAFAETETIVQLDDKVTQNISEKQTPTITLRGEEIFLNDQRVSLDGLTEALSQCGASPQTVIDITSEEDIKTELVTAVKDVLRKSSYLYITYDKRTARILPPAESHSDKVEVQEEVPFILVPERNLMKITIEEDNSIRMEFGGEEWKLGYDTNKILNGVKTFVKNANNSENLPAKRSITLTLPSGESCQFEESLGIIVMKTSSNADFSIHKKCVNSIYRAYNELRDELARELFGRPIDQLTAEQLDVIFQAIPINLSESITTDNTL